MRNLGNSIGLILLFALTVNGQEKVYTLHQYTPLLYNPAVSSMDNAASASIFHEEFTLGAGDFITTNAFNAEYPVIQKGAGRRIGGIGVNFMQKDAGQSDLLKTYHAGISASNHILLTREQSLSLGISGTYVNKRTSMESLTTGSQWMADEFRYDPNATLGETFQVSAINYFSLGTGVLWQYLKDGKNHSFAGISAYHLNRPAESFFEQDGQQEARVPVTYLLNAGTILYESPSVIFTPQLFYTRIGSANSYRMLLSTRLPFKNQNPYDIIQSGDIDLLVNYGFKREASLAVVFNQPGFSFGFGYNFPLARQNNDTYLQDAFQVGLSISKVVWKREPQKVVVEATPQRREFNFGQPGQRPVPVAQSTEVEAIEEKLVEFEGVKDLQLELNKDFRFEFGKAELSEEAKPFLDELYQLLLENPTFRLRIIGHTDNVGNRQRNYQLSMERAQAVADQLIGRGIDRDKIQAIGRADTEPVSANDSEEGRAKNRRVQFIINVNRQE